MHGALSHLSLLLTASRMVLPLKSRTDRVRLEDWAALEDVLGKRAPGHRGRSERVPAEAPWPLKRLRTHPSSVLFHSTSTAQAQHTQNGRASSHMVCVAVGRVTLRGVTLRDSAHGVAPQALLAPVPGGPGGDVRWMVHTKPKLELPQPAANPTRWPQPPMLSPRA